MKVPFLDLARSYEAIADEADACMLAVPRSGAYVLGPNVSALEEEVARYLGMAYAVGVNSGTDALHLAVPALGIQCGDEVITTPFTFAATLEAIQYHGATPVLVDIDPATYNMDPSGIEAAITERTKAIMPVHMFGLPADMPAIMEIARRHELKVIEDCAQSFGAAIGDRRVGSFGDAGAFSYYPTKTLGGIGDGGMVAVHDTDADERLRELRNHGIGAGEHVRLGYNSRLDELQAAILRIRLKHIDAMNDRRRVIAAHYNEVLGAAGARVPEAPDGHRHVYGYYTIQVEDRDALRERLGKAGIATALYYPKSLHRHVHFAKTCRYDKLDTAARVAESVVSLPVFPEMTDEEVDYVARTTADLLS